MCRSIFVAKSRFSDATIDQRLRAHVPREMRLFGVSRFPPLLRAKASKRCPAVHAFRARCSPETRLHDQGGRPVLSSSRTLWAGERAEAPTRSQVCQESSRSSEVPGRPGLRGDLLQPNRPPETERIVGSIASTARLQGSLPAARRHHRCVSSACCPVRRRSCLQ